MVLYASLKRTVEAIIFHVCNQRKKSFLIKSEILVQKFVNYNLQVFNMKNTFINYQYKKICFQQLRRMLVQWYKKISRVSNKSNHYTDMIHNFFHYRKEYEDMQTKAIMFMYNFSFIAQKNFQGKNEIWSERKITRCTLRMFISFV